MRKLAPGIYAEDGVVQFNMREMCRFLGIPYTEQACKMIEEEAIAAFIEVFGAPPTRVTIALSVAAPTPRPAPVDASGQLTLSVRGASDGPL